MMWLALLIILALLSLLLVLLGRRFMRPRLSGAGRRRILAQWGHARSLPDPARRVVEADIVLDHALRELGYAGTFADKLRRVGARFPNLDDIWDAHRLRNRIAHEPGVRVTVSEADRELRTFERALRALLR